MYSVTEPATPQHTKAESALAQRLKALRRGDLDIATPGSPGHDGHAPLVIMANFRSASANMLNVNTAPLEFLYFSRLLATRDDPANAESIRYDVACRVRRLLEQAQVSGLQAQNLNGGGGGAGQVRKRPISEQKAQFILELVELRRAIPMRELRLIEDVIYLDKWVWDGRTRKRRADILESVRKALDRAALYFERMSHRDFLMRWRKSRGARQSSGQRPA
jgi:hypothetical protein